MILHPAFWSERLLPHPWTGCRIASDANATTIATLNESAMTASHRPKGRAAKTADLRRGMRAFAASGDVDLPDQGEAYAIHRAMFPGLPLPRLWSGARWAEVIAEVGSHAVSISLDLHAAPAGSPLLRWTGPVGHQVVLWRIKGDMVKVIDPMHPPGETYTGTWVDISHVKACALAIGEGKVYAESFPAGGWTAERLATVDISARLVECKQERRELRASVADLERQLADRDCTEATEAGREQLLDDLADWITEHRGDAS